MVRRILVSGICQAGPLGPAPRIVFPGEAAAATHPLLSSKRFRPRRR